MANAAQARVELAGELSDYFSDSDVDVFDHGSSRTIVKPTLLVRTTTVARGVVRGIRVITLEVYVISHLVNPGTSDDFLDDFMERTLDALDSFDQVVWTGAERAVFEDTNPAYSITVTRED